MTRRRRRSLGLLLLVGLTLALAGPAHAATYKPTTTGDSNPGKCTKRNCTLREAVIKANAHAGRDTIVLRGGKVYVIKRPGRSEDAAATGDLDLNDDLTIKSSNRRLATVDAKGKDRVFETGFSEEAAVTLLHLRIRGGRTDLGEGGGGVRVGDGSLRIKRSVIGGNRSGRGGALSTRGFGATVRISSSLVFSNRALTNGSFLGHGGGIAVGEDRVTIAGSTIAENRATGDGGGVWNGGSSAELRITNSTINNNSADELGGGVMLSGGPVVTLNSVTVARNLAEADGSGGSGGGGLYNNGAGDFTVRNSIVAENAVGPGGSGPDCWQASLVDYVSAGVNLFGDLDDCNFSEPPDIEANARLGTFGFHGGPTPTIPLKAGSPAINAAGAGSPARDQRGVKRVNPDIGAYERR